MVVALDGVVECVNADVQHSVMRIGVLMDDLVHKTRLIMCREILRSHEMVLVEVSLADRCEVKIYKEYESNSSDGHPALQYERTLRSDCVDLRSAVCPYYKQEHQRDQQQRAERVLDKKRCSVGGKRFHDHLVHAGVACTDE